MASSENQLPRRAFPCGECPVRCDNADNPRSQFPTYRWEELHKSIEQTWGAPMFGCHKGEPGTDADLACAGWLAVFGMLNLTIRMALFDGRLDPDALVPGENWPPLYETWDAMVAGQTWHPGDPDEHLGGAMPAPPGPPDEEMYSIRQVARIFNVSINTVDRWEAMGRFPAIRLPNGHRRWRQLDIDAVKAGRPLPTRDDDGNVVEQSPSRPAQTAVDGPTPERGE